MEKKKYLNTRWDTLIVDKPYVFIPGNAPSSKNSKIKGRFFSKTVQNYLRSFGIQCFSSRKKEVKLYKTIPSKYKYPVEELKELFKNVEYPIKVGLHFIRKTTHKADFINLCQLQFDLWTAFGIIPDDNMDFIIPICTILNKKFYTYDKDNPGIIVTIQ